LKIFYIEVIYIQIMYKTASGLFQESYVPE